MSVALAAEPRIVHTVPGRARVYLPELPAARRGLEDRLRAVVGILSARANALTSHILITFDPKVIDLPDILRAVGSAARDAATPEDAEEPPLPPALRQRKGDVGRARIAVRGLDRNPLLARHVVDRLVKRSGVSRVQASPLTGRVLVEFSHRETTLEEILADVARVELPPLPDEDRPEHPLDPGPLLQSGTRAIGSGVGLGLLAARQLSGFREPAGLQSGAIRFAAAAGFIQGIPFVRYGLRRLLGRSMADTALNVPSIVALTLAGSPLGLALTCAESIRLLTEVVARRSAFQRYEERLEHVPSAHPGEIIRLESGEKTPLRCSILEGFGTATGRHGLPEPVAPGETISAGARLFGGPFVVELQEHEAFIPQPRPAPIAPTFYDRYLRLLSPVSLGYAALTALLTRSLSRTFQAFLLVNARTAMIGADSAEIGASARVLRAGVIVVGTRQDRSIRQPHHLVIGSPRTLSDGFEVTSVVPLDGERDPDETYALAGAVAAACESPWGGAVAVASPMPAADAGFDGRTAAATIGSARYTLSVGGHGVPASLRLRHQGEHLLALRRIGEDAPLGVLVLRPRLAQGVSDLVATCKRRGIEIAMLAGGDESAAHRMAQRTGIPVAAEIDTVEAVRARQTDGSLVYCASDDPTSGAAFEACDLAIGMTAGRTSRFPARADLLAPDLAALTAILEAGAAREASTRDSVWLSLIANAVGAAWGIRSPVGVARASTAVYITALGAIADGWARLRGGERSGLSTAWLVDPRPERWGRRTVEDTLRVLKTSARGLSIDEAAKRLQPDRPSMRRNGLAGAILTQLKSPLTGVLVAGAALSVILGSVADVIMISATIAANVVVGAWQERQTGQAIAALQRIGTSSALVVRDAVPQSVPAHEIVPGDILVLAPGDRVAADARLIWSESLEVDEAALTGESLPVPKAPEGGTDSSRVVLAGSDVTVGSGHAVVVAVGRKTRIGATAAALALDETRASPLGVRLNRMLRQVLPLVGAGGAIVFLSGLIRRRPALPQLAVGASIALAAVPEGLPLLAGVGEAAVARRLADRNALVRRLSAVEALGRVDVACTDKTGTLTEGALALTVVATADKEARPSQRLSTDLRRVLLSGGLATPHPDAAGAAAHPTDIAVTEGVRAAGLFEELRVARDAELPFDPARSFHVSALSGTLYLKGAVEALMPRCDFVLRAGRTEPLDDAGRQAMIDRAQRLAERGLRVLMVAGGTAGEALDDPAGLTALGFLGISDPLRREVPQAVRRCHEAGVRVVMLTGDHPATARAIAREAGLLNSHGHILTGAEISELQNGELDEALEDVTVIARVTPLDKLRIVESLQRRGHTIAMTGDGVNDAPALRLADVGVAMGLHGTEVARQAADVVLADDDFSTLVEALVEGRSFWRNIRRALGLLLGGNLGELGLVVGASLLGLPPPLLTRQILAVNMVTDIAPSLAVALQPPETRTLSRLAREGTAALDRPLANDVRRRGFATAMPALAAFIGTLGSRGLPEARSVAFASIVSTQLAQTLDNGRAEGSLTRSVFGAVVVSVGTLVAALTVPPLREFLGLVTPSPFGWILIGAGSLVSVLLGRGLSGINLALPSPPTVQSAPQALPV